ncbi:MAG: glycosyl hydrolase, partial [bacterium]
MKNFLAFIILISLLTSCKKIKESGTEDRLNTFGEIAELFADPPAEYRTVPFWVWNEKVTQTMIDEQLEDFHDKGFGGVFVHPRYGLITEYASAEWYELVKYAKEKAENLDMYLWLYDENSFPSGFAGGLVPAEMPESYENGIAMKKHEMEVFEPDTSLSWIAFYEKDGEGYTRIENDYEKYIGKEGEFIGIEKVFYQPSKWFGGFTYVDLIHPGVTEKFIEVTMTGYEKTIGEDFGGVVPGIFTDEPNISPRAKGSLRWTTDLFEVFEKTWDYSIEENLVSLFEETGDWKKVRHNYYSVLLDLFIERWSKPWYEYTEEKDLKWTGHYWEHGWPDPVHGGDNMAMYPYHQVPGIDMLFNTMEERPDQFGNVRAVKELSSVANQFGRSRALSETYGASGYELNFHDMKRNGDWQYALGVNLMNQHLSYQSMLGDRKHDFPQTFSYHTPWWDEYRGQADYYARLSLAMSSGFQVNHILVIEPTTSAWMHYLPASDNSELNLIAEDFHRFINEMEYYKIEYDLASEKTMRDFGSVLNEQLVIGERSYSTVVIPYGLTNLDRSTMILLEEFLKDDGMIISFEAYPEFVNGIKTNEVKNLFEEYTGQVEIKNKPDESSLPNLAVTQELEFSPLNKAEFVYFMRRQLSDGDLLFLANFDKGETKEFSLKADKFNNLVELDPISGKFYNVDFEKSENGIRFDIKLEDAGSRLYFLSESKIPVETTEQEKWQP